MTTVEALPDYHLGVSHVSPSDDLRITLLAPKIAKTIPSPPASLAASRVAAVQRVSWGMMLNDSEGDCTVAGEWHTVQALTTFEGKPYVRPDDLVHAEYRGLTGGPDTGLALLDVLKVWKGRDQHGLASYAEVPWTDASLSAASSRKLLKVAVWAAGSAYTAVLLPKALQRNPYDWTTVGSGPDWRAGTWGGHCIPIVAYRVVGGQLRFLIVTWGRLVEVSEAFLRAYMVEAWMPVSRDWLNQNGKTPSGRTLQATTDIALAIAG